jgi:Concanavalin A-like lectin/glucanases superfamily
LNPTASSPFTVEFWAQPSETDGDDSPLSNRIATTGVDRSGWVFFQRGEGTGWNFRIFNGAGSALGWDLTGGTATLNAWSHVVATWSGVAAQLYVNGTLVDSTNDPAFNGVYNPSATATLFTASTDTSSLYKGAVDEVAFYNSALTPAQILNHYNTATSPVEGAYHQLVRTDGALLQLTNNAIPEPASLAFLGLTGLTLLGRRR